MKMEHTVIKNENTCNLKILEFKNFIKTIIESQLHENNTGSYLK